MKKSVRNLLFISLFAVLVVLAACSSAECKASADCKKTGFTGRCADEVCVYTPIPGVCGNAECEADAGENKCTCGTDCGDCSGSVPGSVLLQQTCSSEDKCIVDVPIAKIKQQSITNTVTSAGNTFKITTTFNGPFNFKKDSFSTKIILDNIANFVSNIRITGYELSGVDKNKQNVVLVDQTVNKPVYGKGAEVEDDLHLDLMTSEVEGTVTNPQLKIDYEYTLTQGTTSQQKTAQIVNQLRGVTLQWVKPDYQYDCPSSCDDGNAGTSDSCSESTNFFCEHSPIPGACGNFQCDGNENKCSCASDCGPCSGSAGQYMELGCQAQNCVATVRSGASSTPKSIFDDKNLGAVYLQNRYSYNIPFDTTKDRIRAEFTLYNIQSTTSNVKIESIRALEGVTELGYLPVNQGLSSIGQTFSVDVPITNVAKPEASHTVTLNIAYSYDQNGQNKKASFTRTLEKITFITPGSV